MLYLVKWRFLGQEHVHESKPFNIPCGAMNFGCEGLEQQPPPSDVWIEDLAGSLIWAGKIKEHCRTRRPVSGGTGQLSNEGTG